MSSKWHIVGIKVMASVTLIYSSWLCLIFLPPVLGYGLAIFKANDYSSLRFLILPLCLFSLSVTYLIVSLGMLRLKIWARNIGIYSSATALALSLVVWLASIQMTKIIAHMAVFDLEKGILGFFFIILIFLTAPALLILLFLTHSKIKGIFNEGVIQESKGVTVFAVLFAMIALFSISGSLADFSSVYPGLTKPWISIWFGFTKIIYISELVVMIGLFSLKEIFRKIAIGLVLFDLFRFIIELPFVNIANVYSDIGARVVLIIIVVLELSFIYFFTRPIVKEQFM